MWFQAAVAPDKFKASSGAMCHLPVLPRTFVRNVCHPLGAADQCIYQRTGGQPRNPRPQLQRYMTDSPTVCHGRALPHRGHGSGAARDEVSQHGGSSTFVCTFHLFFGAIVSLAHLHAVT